MISNTKAFIRLKEEQSLLINFAVLICHAVPTLKKSIKGLEEEIENYETLPPADYFRGTDIKFLKEYAKKYRYNLSKYLLVSAFSFFESYFKATIDELIDFHGGKEVFIQKSHLRMRNILSISDRSITESKRKLNEYPKKNKHDKYAKHAELLANNSDYRFPTELLATYGLKYFIEFIQSSNFTSSSIPDTLEYAFHFDLSQKVNKHAELKEKNIRETLEYLRNLRNSIAHGDKVNIGFEKCMDLIRFFRYLTANFDRHLVNNYFILEQ